MFGLKIGGLEVGDWKVKDEGGKTHLIFACRDCPYGSSIVDDPHCRYHVLAILIENEAQLVVLADVYERVYNEKQSRMLVEIAKLITKFENEAPWSYAHLGDPKAEGEELFGERHDAIVKIAHDVLSYDPIAAYILCLEEVKKERARIEKTPGKQPQTYLNNLLTIRAMMEETELISKARDIIMRLRKIPETTALYHSFFEAQIKPSFIGSRLMFEEMEKLELLDEYTVKEATVQVFKHPNKTENLYFINPPEYTLPPDKYFVLSKTREVVSEYKPGKTSLSTIAKSRKYFERIYQSSIRDISNQGKIKLSPQEIIQLGEIVARYTVGYGILEILLSDRKLTDIYLDAPIGQKPIYVVHSDYGQCETNIIYTQDEADSLVSKMRALSGRPFDEAHPVLDLDLPELETRVAVIGPPLSPDGTAFAFRLHKVTPWTLPQFVDAKFLSPLAAGLLSFFVDMQATMLITGSRGSGKTSLAGSLMLEIPQSTRIIVQEDTLEIPVPFMKEIGFNAQRMKTRSPISVSKTETEVAPEEALRTALRLGDSALIIGEVRSKEAKVLYEAMRIGAAGNIVMGTIHGDSAYSVWDRVVNDLGVPNTSFKATDIVVVARPIRFAGSLERHRRVVQITEVMKHWTEDPDKENALLDLMSYDTRKDVLELNTDALKKSELFEKIQKTSGLTQKQIWSSIQLKADSKEFLVEVKNKYKLPELLEAENSVVANNKLLLIKEDAIAEKGANMDYDAVLVKWKEWVNNTLVKRLLAKGKVKAT